VTLTRRTLVSTAAGGAALLAAGCGEDGEEEPREGRSRGDLEVVNYALTLEFLEEDFYEAVVSSGVLSGREADLAKKIRDNESEHVQALSAAAKSLGKPADRPATKFDSVLAGGRDRVIAVAADLEGTGAGAYLAEAARITSAEILASALAIHTVEARHASILNLLAGRSPVPDGAFATPIERPEVERRIARFLV
jgi:rubrerythrin